MRVIGVVGRLPELQVRDSRVSAHRPAEARRQPISDASSGKRRIHSRRRRTHHLLSLATRAPGPAPGCDVDIAMRMSSAHPWSARRCFHAARKRVEENRPRGSRALDHARGRNFNVEDFSGPRVMIATPKRRWSLLLFYARLSRRRVPCISVDYNEAMIARGEAEFPDLRRLQATRVSHRATTPIAIDARNFKSISCSAVVLFSTVY